MKSQWNRRIKEVSVFYIRYDGKTKISRGSEHYIGTFWPNAGIAKWIKLYEWFERFSGCWINSQWKFLSYLSTSVFPTSSDTWRDVEAFFRNAERQRRTAKHLGHTWYIGKRFCKSTCIFIRTLSSRIASMEFVNRGVFPFVHSGEKWKAKTRFEMPVWTVSQKFSHLQWRRLFKEIWSRPTIADFRSSFRQIPYTQPRLLAGR